MITLFLMDGGAHSNWGKFAFCSFEIFRMSEKEAQAQFNVNQPLVGKLITSITANWRDLTVFCVEKSGGEERMRNEGGNKVDRILSEE